MGERGVGRQHIQQLTSEQLKAERTRRHEDAEHPKPHASKLVRTHHAEAKKDAKPKAKKEKEAKPAAKGAHKPTRAEKHATKAAAIEAARRVAVERYAWSDIARRLAAIYDRLCADGSVAEAA